jgi:hypothetical protein
VDRTGRIRPLPKPRNPFPRFTLIAGRTADDLDPAIPITHQPGAAGNGH